MALLITHLCVRITWAEIVLHFS